MTGLTYHLDQDGSGNGISKYGNVSAAVRKERCQCTVLEDATRALSRSNVTDIKLLHLLGSGGFGSVYKGLLGNIPVAVKRLHISTKNEQAKKESFEAELNVLKLKHPHVVAGFAATTLEGDEIDGAVLVMEYVGERNLQHVIDDTQEVITADRRMKYSYQLAQALKYVHSNFIVHLDVKPANILITPDDQIKLGDFGCCQVLEEDTGVVTPYSRSQLTGTYAYRAPELLRGDPPSPKADIYALGITFWQLINRKMPYGDENPHVVIFGVVAYNLRPALEPLEDMTSPLERLYQETFVKCWDADPKARPNASTLKEMFENCINRPRLRF